MTTRGDSFLYKRPINWSEPIRLVLFILTIPSMIFIHLLFGASLLFIALITLLHRKGFEIDSNIKQYRIVTFLFGKPVGGWKELPEIEYISIVGVSMTTRGYSSSSRMFVQQSDGTIKFQINLFSKNSKIPITILTTGIKKKAFETAVRLGSYMSCNVLDSTKRKQEWIKTDTTNKGS